MGLLDALRVRDDSTPEYSSHGEQPGPPASGVLGESDRHLDALARHQGAAELHAAQASTDAPPIIPALVVESAGNPDWEASTVTLSPGIPVMILGRDRRRKTAEVNLWTAGVAVAICKTRKDAESASHAFPPARSWRLPGGGTVPRKITHNAPVYAVLDPAAGADATLDVSVELAGPAKRNRDDD